MQLAGLYGNQVILLLEDHHFVDTVLLELTNSLLSAGEVPRLYTTEELEPLLAPLQHLASQEGYTGTLFSYYCSKIKSNLHVILIMDSANPNFARHHESNPVLYTRCSFQSMEFWLHTSMIRIPHILLSGYSHRRGSATVKSDRPLSGGDELLKAFLHIHQSCLPTGATPRRYMTLLRTYQSVYGEKKSVYGEKKQKILKKQSHLQV